MGVEYYLVKPEKREIFELGRHIQPFECLKVSYSTADYIDCENFKEFFLDIIDSNNGILGDDWKYGDVVDFAYLMYDWCEGEKVFQSSDCSSDWKLFKDYNVTGSIYNFCEERHPAW